MAHAAAHYWPDERAAGAREGRQCVFFDWRLSIVALCVAWFFFFFLLFGFHVCMRACVRACVHVLSPALPRRSNATGEERSARMVSPEGLDPVKAQQATIFFSVLGALQIVLLVWSVYILHGDFSDALAVLPLLINQVVYRTE